MNRSAHSPYVNMRKISNSPHRRYMAVKAQSPNNHIPLNKQVFHQLDLQFPEQKKSYLLGRGSNITASKNRKLRYAGNSELEFHPYQVKLNRQSSQMQRQRRRSRQNFQRKIKEEFKFSQEKTNDERNRVMFKSQNASKVCTTKELSKASLSLNQAMEIQGENSIQELHYKMVSFQQKCKNYITD